jgi:predicted AAA+ superfamily ATPase
MIDLNSFNLQNPWRHSHFIPDKVLQHLLLHEVLAWMNDPDILVVIGSRQVGKTTLLYQIIEHLLATGAATSDIFYFNLDDWSLIEFFKTPADFLSFIELNKKHRAYVFIDEAQRLENPGLFLKYIYDLKKKSSSL